MMSSPLLIARDEPPPSALLARTTAMLSRLVGREDDPEVCKASPHLCEKPAVSSQTLTYALVGGIL